MITRANNNSANDNRGIKSRLLQLWQYKNNLTLKSAFSGFSIAFIMLLSISITACSGGRTETDFTRNLKADRENPMSEEEFLSQIDPVKYDTLIQGIGKEEFDQLTYGVGQSNMVRLMNAINEGDKLVALMSEPNRLSSVDVLDMLLKTNSACSETFASSNDTIGKIANLINMVSLEGMKGLKAMLHNLEDNPNDVNGANYTDDMARLGMLIAIVDEGADVMPTLVDNVAAPEGCVDTTMNSEFSCISNGHIWLTDFGGLCIRRDVTDSASCNGTGQTWYNDTYSPEGAMKLATMLNQSDDLQDVANIINATTSLSNLTEILQGLTLDDTCSNATDKLKHECLVNGASWDANDKDGVNALSRVVNEATAPEKLATIVNKIGNVSNLNGIMNNLTNDGKKPGDTGNTEDGVDAMVSTINNVTDLNRLTYVVNNLDQIPVSSNDESFEEGADCTNGQFENRLNWAFSYEPTVTDPATDGPWYGKQWRTGGGANVHAGSCSLRNRNWAAGKTGVDSAEIIANLTTTGSLTFYKKSILANGEYFKVYINDVLKHIETNKNDGVFSQVTIPFSTTGRKRIRFEVVRNGSGATQNQVFIDQITLPGDKGAARLASEKVAIMLNKLNITSIDNVADILNNVTAPCTAPITGGCTASPTGLEALVGILNRVEYPADIATDPKMVQIVNDLTNYTVLTDMLNSLDSNGFKQAVAMINNIDNGNNVKDLVNALASGGGNKVSDILNDLTPQGTSAMITMLDTVATADLQTLIDNVTGTQPVAELLNHLDLKGREPTTTSLLGDKNGGQKLSDIFAHVNTSSTVHINPHLSTLVNDLAAGSGGAANVGIIVSHLDPDATGASGQQRMVDILEDLSSIGSPRYTDPTSNATSDEFGRLTTLINDMGASGGENIADLVNGINYARIAWVEQLLNDTNRVKYLSRLVTESGDMTLILELLNDPATNLAKIIDLLNDMGDNTANFGDPAIKYTDQLDYPVTDNDKLGRLITFINGITGGVSNVVTLINGVDTVHFVILKDLLKNTHRIKYLTRLINEADSMTLIIDLINNSPDSTRLQTLLDTVGDATYGSSTGIGSYTGAIYGDNPSGSGCTLDSCDTNTTDKLGKVIVMVNSITNITDTTTLINDSQDFNYVLDLIQNVNRIRYLTHIINNLQNIDLMIKVLNGADACSVYAAGINDTNATDTAANCSTAGGTWSGVGRCVGHEGSYTTKSACTANGHIWRGTEYSKLLTLINGIGDTTIQGSGTKDVGDMLTLYDTVNKLGYNGATPRVEGKQVRVVRVINAVEYCGIRKNYDKYIQYGPTCHNGGTIMNQYQHKEACENAGYSWQAKTVNTGWVDETSIFHTCNDPTYNKPTVGPTNGGYYNNGDDKDGRDRLLQMMLGVDDGTAMSVIVGEVQDTNKTINILNGTRRISTIAQAVNWMPGEVTAKLVNETHWSAILRSFIYLANNLHPDEDEAAKTFARMIHFGTRVEAQGGEFTYECNCSWGSCDTCTYAPPTPTCLEFTALGPGRLASVLNLEAGPYLEGLLSALGPDMAVAAMNCGWARDDNEHSSACPATSDSDSRQGGMYKAVGRSYIGTPKPGSNQCIRSRETVSHSGGTFRYGDYTWGASNNQGVRWQNCQSTMPKKSGGSVLGITIDKATDKMIWEGLDRAFGAARVDDGIGDDEIGPAAPAADIWSILKGQGDGIVGWVMSGDGSSVGFPDPRGFGGATPLGGSSTACSDDSGDNNDNWQCIREGLADGDLGSTTNGYYWGTYCAGADTSGTGTTRARNCISNGGLWKTEKNYQSSSCTLDPATDAAIQP